MEKKVNVNDALRARVLARLVEVLTEDGEEVMQTASGTLMFPTVEAGEDRWVKLSVIIPKKADEEDGTDGYALANEYRAKLADKAEKAEAKEAERKQYCEKMRTNLAQLENNPRLREEVNGEVRRLDENERQKRIAEAKKAIAENCQ